MEIFILLSFILILTIVAEVLRPVSAKKRSKGSADYCLLDTFRGSCEADEVIIIESALYGRMAKSKCVQQTKDNVGCFVQVKNILDGLCSGKQNCDIPVVDRRLLATKPCAENVASYLTVSYHCLKVHRESTSHCKQGRRVSITTENGFLSSAMATSGSPGSSRCPWQLKPQSGRQLNITLYKYSLPTDGSRPPVCYEVATIKEENSIKNILLCPSDPSVKPIYISEGGTIEITFNDHSINEESGSVVLHYQATGCHNPSIPKEGHFKRHGSKVTIKCNHTKVEYDLTCQNNEWKGDEVPCDAGWSLSSVMGTDTSYQYGVLLIVVTGIALGVLIGGFLLYLAINAFKRYHGLLPAQQIQNPSYEKPFYNPNKMAYNDRTIQRSSMIYGTNRRSYPNRQMLPPVPPPHADNAQMRPPSEISEANRQSHIYETPLFNSL